MKLILISALFISLISSCDSGSRRQRPTSSQFLSDSSQVEFRPKPIYDVYIENSASMDGYVNGITEFKSVVYNYLSDIKIRDLTDTINLNYINSIKIPYGNNVADFIEKLDPATFRSRAGNRGSTDISDVLKMVLCNSDTSNVSILISDFIFSPGRAKDADQYLINQEIGIKNNVAEYLKSFPSNGIIIYHLESKFKGAYYNKYDFPNNIDANRPYYIWIIGDRAYLKDLVKQCPINSFRGNGVLNSFAIVQGGEQVKYKVNFGSGNFKLDKLDPNKSIVNAKKDSKGSGDKRMRFSVDVDFSNLLLDDTYLADLSNYDISDKDYGIEIKNNKGDRGYSHTIYFSTQVVKPSVVKLRLKTNMPQWINSVNDDIGLNVNESLNKTFGLQYLIKGVYDAFTIKGNYCAEITVRINQN